MKFNLWIFPAIFIYCLLISATSIKVSPKYNEGRENYKSGIISPSKGSSKVYPKKLNFFEKLMVKILIKKYKRAYRLADISKADNLANLSIITGSAAMLFFVLGLFAPYVILASIPAAIAAMITGGAALRKGTKQIGKARTGKAFGLGILLAFALLAILATIIISSSDWW